VRERTGPFLKFWYRISILSVSVLRAHVPLLAEFFRTKKKTFFKAESKKTTTTTHKSDEMVVDELELEPEL